MKGIKVFLVFNVIAWLPYGIACLFNPGLLTELVGIAMNSAAATSEIRSMYGGVQTAVGVMCLVALVRASMIKPALAMVAFILAGIASARFIGLVLDASGSEYTYGALAFETVVAIVAFILFNKTNRESAG